MCAARQRESHDLSGAMPPMALAPGTKSVLAPDQSRLAVREMAVLSRVVTLLLANGQTTERIVQSVERLARRWQAHAAAMPGWGETALHITDGAGTRAEIVFASPVSVDMRKVTAASIIVDDVATGRRDLASAAAELDSIASLPPPPLIRFSTMAAFGAAALAVVFGATRLADLTLVAATAGAGALARRGLSRVTTNLFVQPLAAALIAGLVGALVSGRQFIGLPDLVSVCPCMVLVPGPHLLNGSLDVVRGRIPLGAVRIAYAGTTILMICCGLLLGLAIGGAALAVDGPASSVPFVWDVPAAGGAVLAYGTFFNMPWRTLAIPVLIGMAAHALRWILMGPAHASPALGAFCACLLVGTLMTPIADRLHLPYAGCAFAAVVSLIPGLLLFRMAGLLVLIMHQGNAAQPALVTGAVVNGATAFVILLAMAAGLILPKLIMDSLGRRA